MLAFEFDDLLFALKYKSPAFEPLFQFPPTLSTRQPVFELTFTTHNHRCDAQTVPKFYLIYRVPPGFALARSRAPVARCAGGCGPQTP